LLLHGEIQIEGKTYDCLAHYFFKISKEIQKGHSCNTSYRDVQGAISSPQLQVDGNLLNHLTAIVCDVVHWGLTDYVSKRTAQTRNIPFSVCIS
jgi:hypothetical protein